MPKLRIQYGERAGALKMHIGWLSTCELEWLRTAITTTNNNNNSNNNHNMTTHQLSIKRYVCEARVRANMKTQCVLRHIG